MQMSGHQNCHAHEVVHSSNAGTVLPVALYMDGVPCTKRDGMIGVHIVNMVSGARHVVAVLRMSASCQCGCKGWCTLHAVFEWLAWSLRSLAAGTWPAQRHGAPWQVGDKERARRAGAPLASKAVVCHLRGDWSESANTCGFPAWASQTDPCFVCCCPRRNWRTLDGINMLEWSWPKKTTDMYLAACTANECRVIVDTPTVRALIAGSLEYDKDSRGAQGRLLRVDLPAFGFAEAGSLGAFSRSARHRLFRMC